jgi:hypothetical protein
LPSTTTSTSYSADGKRLVTSSYCLNSGELERNSWESESSTVMRVMPKPAPTQSSTAMTVRMAGIRSEMSPMRSSPSARANCLCPAEASGCPPVESPARLELSDTFMLR